MKVKENDIRVNAGNVEICTKIVYTKEGLERHWEDYDTRLLASTLGQCGHSDEFYPLLRYKETFDMTKAEMETKEKQIKIRYAYLGSPTNLRIDPAYYESLSFKVLTIEELELGLNRLTLEELITDGEEALIKIIGRDRCTCRVDMIGNDIYEGDIVRWYTDDGKHVYANETVDAYTHFYEQESERDCKVIGTKYDKGDI